jgi:hypothetical protein
VLTAPGGELRVWATPWHQERALPVLRALLELPFEHVIVSHGEPVHTRAAYERTLARSLERIGHLTMASGVAHRLSWEQTLACRQVAGLGPRAARGRG